MMNDLSKLTSEYIQLLSKIMYYVWKVKSPFPGNYQLSLIRAACLNFCMAYKCKQ